MVRIARKASGSGIYHVVMRGAGRQLLFEDDRDRRRFLEFMHGSFADHGVKLLCYCLMPNHVHLIAQGELSALSAAMHLLGTRYALRFNKKSDHCGPVFEDRFYSDPIETDAHFFSALRYVLLNPEHAGICPTSEYPWSSYSEYVGEPVYCDASLVSDLLGDGSSVQALVSEGDVALYRFEGKKGMDDLEAVGFAREVVGRMDIGLGEIKMLPKHRRSEALRELKSAGLSTRQIERLTGIGRSTIARA